MGYSVAKHAALVMDALMEAHRHQNSANTYSVDGGKTIYFWERGREQNDGAMTGTVLKLVGENSARPVGSFRIEPNGIITRFPGIPKKFWAAATATADKQKNECSIADTTGGMLGRWHDTSSDK